MADGAGAEVVGVPGDTRVWRVLGDPLVAGAPGGPLAGEDVAVKDLFAVAGHRVGAGVPAYLAEQAPATGHADAVRSLLDAGADVRGIAQTDELAYSLAGRNPRHGTPPNPAVPDGVPGGSSSGPAAAVALGDVSIGLGTDTGGSVRVPASYQGLWGLRTTHGSVPAGGLVPLAPSFDTVGWLTRDARTLAAVVDATLPNAAPPVAAPPVAALSGGRPLRAVVLDPHLLAHAEPDVRVAVDAATALLTAAGVLDDLTRVELPDVDELVEVFRTIQAHEAWRTHGDWLTRHPEALGPDVGARFRWASTITDDDAAVARSARRVAVQRLEDLLGDRVLVLPSASSAAPAVHGDPADGERTRASTLRLTCLAGLTGRPALSIPVLAVDRPGARGRTGRVGGTDPAGSAGAPGGAEASGHASDGVGVSGRAPVGLCLVGPRGSERALVATGARWAEVLGTVGPPP
jgi:Asp-tRNA(Asn)/Glu-tRNA(Gln) amidotransferase A subunit family amidase